MALPWLRIIDAALGVTDLVRSRKVRPGNDAEAPDVRLAPGAIGGLETRLAGVVVAALKEAFDRDTHRLELEREQLEADRRRAERALRLELLRQAGDREIGRLRLLAGIAVASWMGTLFFSVRVMNGPTASRVLLAAGWAMLLAAVATAFKGQSTVARALEGSTQSLDSPETRPSAGAGEVAPWLIVVGLGLVGAAVLVF
jgi:hypothetical protein